MKIRWIILVSLFATVAVAQWTVPHRRAGFAAGSAFAPSSATWDGSGDRINFSGSAVTMSGAGKVLTVCFWVDVDAASGVQIVLYGRDGTSGPVWRVWVGDNVQILIQNSSSLTVYHAYGNGSLTTGWHHVMLSVNTVSAVDTRMYLDGTNYFNDHNDFTADGILALNRTNLYVGASDDSTDVLAGCLAEVWVDDSYIDFSNSTNRDKFYLAGDPVDLGASGATPTGSAPDLYMKFVSGSLGVNSGADGGTGALEGNVAVGDCGAVGN